MEIHFIMGYVKGNCLAKGAEDLMDDPIEGVDVEERVEMVKLEKV